MKAAGVYVFAGGLVGGGRPGQREMGTAAARLMVARCARSAADAYMAAPVKKSPLARMGRYRPRIAEVR
jgi:hypothetical protein